jgi:HAD superfamily hydrolase (TIGR01450 family)
MIAADFDAFLFDLDGVLFRGHEPIAGAAEAVARLRTMGKRLAFVTNNSARTPDDVAAHLARVGVDARPSEVETSALTTASYAADAGIRTAVVIGSRGLREALAGAGVRIEEDAGPVDAAIVGWDPEARYDDLRRAAVAVQRGAAFIASNPDTSYPAPDGTRWPGAGALAAAVTATTGVEATVIGKPNGPILLAALARAGGGDPLLIGDRLDTDVEGARRLGWPSMLVLTGISTREDVRAAGFSPTYVVDDLGALFD